MAPTVHRLLWGPRSENDLARWRIRTWETPAVGLPVRVACVLFTAARRTGEPEGWNVGDGPLTWQFRGDTEVLANGRRVQFDDGRDRTPWPGPVDVNDLGLARTGDWELLPHEAYLLPFVNENPDNIDRAGYVLYCDVLLLITADSQWLVRIWRRICSIRGPLGVAGSYSSASRRLASHRVRGAMGRAAGGQHGRSGWYAGEHAVVVVL